MIQLMSGKKRGVPNINSNEIIIDLTKKEPSNLEYHPRMFVIINKEWKFWNEAISATCHECFSSKRILQS